jgi:DNA-binding NarL/FixJ family response regulator
MIKDSKTEKVLIVEENSFVRQLICELISNLGYQCEAASNYNDAIKLSLSFSPDLVITELDLGSKPTGVDLINTLVKEFPKIQLVALTTYTSPTLIDSKVKSFPSRVQYILKNNLPKDLSFKEIIQNVLDHKEGSASRLSKPADAIFLSNSQAELLKLMAQGLSNQAIAKKRGTTLRAVEALINRTFDAMKLNEHEATNLRVEAVKLWNSSKIYLK